MADPDTSFQLSTAAAEAYETRFVPAIFAPWAPLLVDAAGVAPGQDVLDVGCGTGIVARTAADRVRGEGRVAGVDLNEGMLAVARRLRPDLGWQQGDATALPFPDATFDTVLSQAVLMFLGEPAAALHEMARVTRDGGTVAVQVWASLDAQTGWAPFYEAVRRHAGPRSVEVVSSYWRLGDRDALVGLCTDAGLRVQHATTVQRDTVYRSADEFVATEIEGTPLAASLGTDALDRLRLDTGVGLAPFQRSDGRLAVPIQGHLVVARR